MKKLKKLQSNFTTIEQSNRLLELGVPEDSADLIIESGCDVKKTIPSWTVFTKWCQNRRDYSVDYEKFMPCWSVGRLIEILNICSIWGNVSIHRTDREVTQIEQLIEILQNRINGKTIDFSKLEE